MVHTIDPKSYLVLHSSLFGPDGAINYDYIVTNSINSDWLKMYSQWHTQSYTLILVEPIWPMLQNISNTLNRFLALDAFV